jgi:hypothetical protein
MGGVPIRSRSAANGPGGLHWPHDGAVVEVEDVELARQLLAIDGFDEATLPPADDETEPTTEIVEPDPASTVTEPEPASGGDTNEPDPDGKGKGESGQQPRRRPRAKPVTEQG